MASSTSVQEATRGSTRGQSKGWGRSRAGQDEHGARLARAGAGRRGSGAGHGGRSRPGVAPPGRRGADEARDGGGDGRGHDGKKNEKE